MTQRAEDLEKLWDWIPGSASEKPEAEPQETLLEPSQHCGCNGKSQVLKDEIQQLQTQLATTTKRCEDSEERFTVGYAKNSKETDCDDLTKSDGKKPDCVDLTNDLGGASGSQTEKKRCYKKELQQAEIDGKAVDLTVSDDEQTDGKQPADQQSGDSD